MQIHHLLPLPAHPPSILVTVPTEDASASVTGSTASGAGAFSSFWFVPCNIGQPTSQLAVGPAPGYVEALWPLTPADASHSDSMLAGPLSTVSRLQPLDGHRQLLVTSQIQVNPLHCPQGSSQLVAGIDVVNKWGGTNEAAAKLLTAAQWVNRFLSDSRRSRMSSSYSSLPKFSTWEESPQHLQWHI